MYGPAHLASKNATSFSASYYLEVPTAAPIAGRCGLVLHTILLDAMFSINTRVYELNDLATIN